MGGRGTCLAAQRLPEEAPPTVPTRDDAAWNTALAGVFTHKNVRDFATESKIRALNPWDVAAVLDRLEQIINAPGTFASRAAAAKYARSLEHDRTVWLGLPISPIHLVVGPRRGDVPTFCLHPAVYTDARAGFLTCMLAQNAFHLYAANEEIELPHVWDLVRDGPAPPPPAASLPKYGDLVLDEMGASEESGPPSYSWS